MNGFGMVTNNGTDIDMTAICGCREAVTLSECESSCPCYSSCCNVALANDILAEYERNGDKEDGE